MQATQDRPPYVVFETRLVEDRDATIEAGHYVTKDAIFALITPQGSKDRVERIADEWIQQNYAAAREGRFPDEWARAFDHALKAYKEGREIPESGVPIVTWPAASPSQIKLILDANIRTVEDLAQANEASINAIGMGGRALKQKAQAWLDAAGDTGKAALEIEDLRQKVEDLTMRAEKAEADSLTLARELEVLKKVKEAA